MPDSDHGLLLHRTEDLKTLQARALDELKLLKESTKALDRERRGIDKSGTDADIPLLQRTLAHVEAILADPDVKNADRLRAATIITTVYGEIRKERSALVLEAGKRMVEAQSDINKTMVAHRRLDIEERVADMQAGPDDPDAMSPGQLERLVNGQ